MAAVILFTLIFPFTTVSAAPAPPFEITSEAVYMVNLDTDTVVYEKNSDKRMYPASLTKIMTTILALENTPDLDNTIVKCKNNIWGEFEGINISHAGIMAGEERPMRDLLYCMMVQSANEAASIVADYIGDGSIPDFCDMMNEKAESLGAVSTHFANPHGLHNDDHYTTAQDMYLIARYAMTLPTFMDMASSTSYTLKPSNKRGTEYLATTNKMMVKSDSQYYPYVKGIKTGYTEEAGRCVISTATKDGYTYMLVILGAPTTDSEGNKLTENRAFAESKKLYEWAFDTFAVKKLLESETAIAEVPLKLNWDKDYMHVQPAGEFSALVPGSAEIDDVIKRTSLPEFINAPVKKGDKIGTVEIMVSGEKIGSVDLIATEDAERSELLYWFEVLKSGTKTVWFYIGIGAFVLLLLIMIVGSIIVNSSKPRRPRFTRRNYY